MKIEEVDALEQDVSDDLLQNRFDPVDVFYAAYVKCVTALRAEAWYPIERAEEMGVDSGSRYLVAFAGLPMPDFAVYILGKWYQSGVQVFPSHFKRISPPEA